MATVIYPSPIFGPVHSRRLGVSLGINLLPEDGKWCTFDCVYCECGFNKDFRPKKPLPTREEVRTALEERLKSMSANGPVPDVLTFAGNGEPTLHPHFAEIIEDTRALRDRYFPKAKISVLSNATQIFRPEVFEALRKVDNNILKLDTVDEGYIRRVDRPTGRYEVSRVVERLKDFPRQSYYTDDVHERHVGGCGCGQYFRPFCGTVVAYRERNITFPSHDLYHRPRNARP